MTLEPTPLRPVGVPSRASTGASASADDAEAKVDIVAVLVERARSGDMQAWSRLYQEHFDGLFRHLRYLTGDAQTAEELVQDTFVQALSCIARFDGRARFSTWLHGIALNVARHHWRAQRNTAKAHAKLTVVHEIVDAGSSGSPDRTMAARQRVRALYDALDLLPEHLREAFILRELEGLAPAEAAEQLGITANNLAVRASRARTRIRKQLVRLGYESSESSRENEEREP
ncbi:RNA polymerase sigma factor [Nannocystaceae bacterium ST9]